MRQCPHAGCRKGVPWEAKYCPHCGKKLPERTFRSISRRISHGLGSSVGYATRSFGKYSGMSTLIRAIRLNAEKKDRSQRRMMNILTVSVLILLVIVLAILFQELRVHHVFFSE